MASASDAAHDKSPSIEYSREHPALAEITRQLVSLETDCPDLQWSWRIDSLIQAGTVCGKGWQLHLDIPVPAGPYGHRKALSVSVVVPETFPSAVPHVRVCSIIYHPSIGEDGVIDPSVFVQPGHLAESEQRAALNEPRSETVTDGAGVSGTRTSLSRIVQRIQSLLAHPFGTAADEAGFDGGSTMPFQDQDLLEFWAQHESDCNCPLGRLLPVDFASYKAADERTQTQLLSQFRQAAQEQHSNMFLEAASHDRKRLELVRSWQLSTARPDLYKPWSSQCFDPRLLDAVQSTSDDEIAAKLIQLVRMETPGVFSFDFLRPEFCDYLLEELVSFEQSPHPKIRPNSMNRYGIVLNDMGFEEVFDHLLGTVVQTLARHLLPDAAAGFALDSHHTFMVQYQDDEDVSLDMHSDDSEVTLNINLYDKCQGSGLTFCGVHGSTEHRKKSVVYHHRKGRAVLHAGLHRHGADELTAGARFNLVHWARSSMFRASDAFMQRRRNRFNLEEAPDLVCLSRTHDADYNHWAHAHQASATVDD